MVARICSVFTILTWLTVPVSGFGAEPAFRLVVATTRVEYGKPVDVDLSVSESQTALNTLDLSALDGDFVVETRDNAERDTETGRQHWRIRLYPRRPGELWLPALSFQGNKTEPVKLMVESAVDHKDNTPILVNSDVGNIRVWINQAVRVTMQIESDSRYAWLVTGSAQQDGIKIVAIPHTRASRTLNGVQRALHRIGWILYPQTTGTFMIQLPAVKYQRDGVITHRFYPPEIELHVRALPAFVPPTMPIGRMQLDVSLPDKFFLIKRELSFLSLRIRREGSPAEHPYSVLRQLKSNQSVTFYPPQNRVDEGDRDTTNANEYIYQVPFAPNVMGLIRLPSVRLQYFDPSTGKIETHTQSLGRLVSISQWLVYAGLAMLLAVLYWLTNAFYHGVQRKYRIYRAYRTALYRLQQATTPQAVKAALMEIASGECWPTNLTLAVWLERWLARYPQLSSVSESVRRLQEWLYGQTEETLDELLPCFIDICYRRIPLLKISLFTQRSW